MKQHWLLAMFLAMTIGCSSVEKPMAKSKVINLNTTLFAFEPVVSEQELFSLTKVQQQEFSSFYQLETSKGYLPHEVIERFLQNNLSNFTYYGKTYIASKAMLNNSGNCMSLALLTTAFSRLVGVEMAYRKMHSLPMYEKHGNVILSSSHVQSLLYDPSFIPEENYIYLNRPAILIDYFPQEGNIRSKTVNTTRFIAMYYINKAAEYYIESDLNKAFAYANQAYQLDNESASAMNLLALLHKRQGDEVTAERLYLAAMESSDVNISVLDNYVNLLRQQGRIAEVQKIKKQIENIYDPNPYHWLEKAQLARSQNELDESEKFYRKAIKLAPYVKQAYLELHEVYLLQGRKSLAISTLQKSLPWLHEPKQKRQYKKKLYQLSAAI